MWLPFDLHPEYPPEGIPTQQLHARYGDAFHERLKQSFAGSGLVYNPPPDVVPNTMRALRVSELARECGLHRHVHDRLMRAYWKEASNIGDSGEVLALAVEAGSTRKRLPGDHGRRLARTGTRLHRPGSIDRSHRRPGFLLNRLFVLGAQPRAVFEQALAQLDKQGPTH